VWRRPDQIVRASARVCKMKREVLKERDRVNVKYSRIIGNRK